MFMHKLIIQSKSPAFCFGRFLTERNDPEVAALVRAVQILSKKRSSNASLHLTVEGGWGFQTISGEALMDGGEEIVHIELVIKGRSHRVE